MSDVVRLGDLIAKKLAFQRADAERTLVDRKGFLDQVKPDFGRGPTRFWQVMRIRISVSPDTAPTELKFRRLSAVTVATMYRKFMPYCSKSPPASGSPSFVVIQNTAESRATTDRSMLALNDGARRDQRIAEALMVALEMMMSLSFPKTYRARDRAHIEFAYAANRS